MNNLTLAIATYNQLNVLEADEFLKQTGLVKNDADKWLDIVERLNGQNDIMTIEQTAVFLNKSVATIRNYIKKGEIKLLFQSGDPLISKKQLLENAKYKDFVRNNQTLPSGKRKYTKKATQNG